MAITISGENNNDRILAQDGVIDQISGINIVGLITASHIDVGSNINLGNAGIVTATTFVGNLTGNVNSTSPLLLQTGGSERFRITGNNELGIAGANYGSSGQVLTSGGSGSAVTWSAIPSQVTIANNADNRVITGGSGTNLNGEANLTYDGSKLVLAANSTAYDAFQVGNGLFIGNTTNNVSAAIFHQGGGADLEIGSQDMITFTTGSTAGNASERLKIDSGGVISVNGGNATSSSVFKICKDGNGEAQLRFETAASNTASIVLDSTEQLKFKYGGTEVLRIDSSGRTQIGSSTLTNYNNFDGPGRLNINNNSADETVDFSQGIVFTDNVNNNGTWTHAGIVCTGSSGYNGNLIFGTDNTGARDNSASNITERLRITSDGKVGINKTNPEQELHIVGDSDACVRLTCTDGGVASFQLGDASDTVIGGITLDSSDNSIQIRGNNNSERLRITSAGKVALGSNLNTNPSYELHLQGSASNGGLYAFGRNHYLANESNAYASLTLKKSQSSSDATDYLQLRDSANGIKFTISGDGTLKILDSIIHEGDTDTKIRFPAADQIQLDTGGTNYLKLHRYSSVNFVEVGASAQFSLADNGSGNRYIVIGDGNASSTGALKLQAGGGSTGWGGGITMYSHANTTNAGGVYIGKSLNSDGAIIFGNGGTSPSNQYLRITSEGKLIMGSGTTTGDSSERFLVDGSGSSDHCGLGIKTNNNLHDGYIAFHDTDANFRGKVVYDHQVDSMFFTTNGGAAAQIRLSIDAGGLIKTVTRGTSVRRMILSGSPTNTAFNIEAHDGASGTGANTNQGELGLYYNDGSTLTDEAVIKFYRGSGAEDGHMVLTARSTEMLSIGLDQKDLVRTHRGFLIGKNRHRHSTDHGEVKASTPYYTGQGEKVFGIDPSWSNEELQKYFRSDNVQWYNDETAPGGYCIQIDGAVNVGGDYRSGFPYIPIDDDDQFFQEMWIRTHDGSQNHYAGSIQYNKDFAGGTGWPGSYGYELMSNTTINSTSWTRRTATLGPNHSSSYSMGSFRSDSSGYAGRRKYWTPQALFNYINSSGTRRCYISGWSVYRRRSRGNTHFASISADSNKGFRIPHPLTSKRDEYDLFHNALEGPKMDLIYRGKVNLVGGSSTVNLDTTSEMTEGTFVLLNHNVQCFTSNESGWTPVKGSVSGNILTITAQDNTSTDTIAWMVVGERHDDCAKGSEFTDGTGKLIVELRKDQQYVGISSATLIAPPLEP